LELEGSKEAAVATVVVPFFTTTSPSGRVNVSETMEEGFRPAAEVEVRVLGSGPLEGEPLEEHQSPVQEQDDWGETGQEDY